MNDIPVIAKQLQMRLNQASDLSQLSTVKSMIFIKRDWIQENTDAIAALPIMNVCRLMIVGMDALVISVPLSALTLSTNAEYYSAAKPPSSASA